MRCGHHPASFSLLAFSEAYFPERARSDKEAPSDLAIAGLSPEVLAALPGEARDEYLAAYRRARSLATAAVMPVIETGRRERAELV